MRFSLRLVFICMGMALAGCPSDSTNATNTGTITVTTLPNNVVSIGASGTNFKTADVTGKAVFTGLTPGAVDVHIFSADGYSATSYMGINTASLVDANMGSGIGSFVDVYVQVVNPNPDPYSSIGYYLTTASGSYSGYDYTGLGNILFDLWDVAPGTTVAGTLYATQGVPISSAGNIMNSGGSEKVNLGNISLTTLASPGTSQQSFTANFAATPPVAPPTLVTLQSVTPPAGMSVVDASFGEVFESGAGFSGVLALPDTIQSVALGDNSYQLSAGGLNGFWFRVGTFTVGSTISVAATLTSPPTMTAGQSGLTLSWANSAAASSVVLTDIYDSTYAYDWSIYSAAGTTSVTLPTVPSVVGSPLASGSAYLVDVLNFKEFSGLSYEQMISATNGTVVGDFEGVGVFLVPYTR